MEPVKFLFRKRLILLLSIVVTIQHYFLIEIFLKLITPNCMTTFFTIR